MTLTIAPRPPRFPVEFTWEELCALHEEKMFGPEWNRAMQKIEMARVLEEGSCGAVGSSVERTQGTLKGMPCGGSSSVESGAASSGARR